jgi:hypothetical protein
MDGEFIGVDGELFGRQPRYVSPQARGRYSDHLTVDWISYGEVLQASSRIMDNIARHVTVVSKTKAIHLPILVAENVQDYKWVLWDCILMRHLTFCGFRSVLRVITLWLDDPAWMRVSNNVLMYIQSYGTSGAGVYNNYCGYVVTVLKGKADFSIVDFSSRLPQLLSATLGIVCGRTFHTNVYIVKEEYEALFKQFRDQLRSENDALVESRAMRNSRLLFKRPLPLSNGSQR